MNRAIVCFFIFIFYTSIVSAQMSDNQIIDYVKQEVQKGVPQDDIAKSLLARGVTPDQLKRVKAQVEQQQNKNGKKQTDLSEQADGVTRTMPAIETSALSDFKYPKDSVSVRRIYGKDIFNKKNLTFSPVLNIPTPVDYKLGPGDEVVIDVWGVYQTTIRQVISPEGSITIERIGPVYLSGMTIEEANAYVKQKLRDIYSDIGGQGESASIKLTLGQIRTIQVNVMGEIKVPGTYSLSSLSSVFQALYNAGGINDIGSLRSIQLYRGGRLVTNVDIYKYLIKGESTGEIRLTDGDMIIVPPYQALVEIDGKVKRPMYYEMLPSETVSNLLEYSGGFTGDAYKDQLFLSRKSGKYNKVYTIGADNFNLFTLQDGDSINVNPGLNLYENRVSIEGAVFRPGFFEVGKEIKTVKDLIIKAGGLRENAFLGRAVLTRERDDLRYETLSINLGALMSGKISDIPLKKNDVLLVVTEDILGMPGDITILGDIVNPGPYQFAYNTTIEDMILKAGGLLNSASLAKVDVARRIINPKSTSTASTITKTYTFEIKDGLLADGASDFKLEPYDQIYIRRSPESVPQRVVFVEGEVLFPGGYALEWKNERVSNIVKRAGNVTPYAYTKGAKLLRELSLEEMVERKKTLKNLTSTSLKDSISGDSLAFDKYYTVGLELDKAILNPKSEYDLVMKPGDKLIIPEFDNTVKIYGAVMRPNTVLYKPDMKAKYYVEQAGGYSEIARKKNVYVVYMNGQVAKIKGSSKNQIQPGCEIIVPSKNMQGRMTVGEKLSIGASITSMTSVVALLINALTN